MRYALTLRTALLMAPLAAVCAAANPLPGAQAVWRMTTAEAAVRPQFALKENGPVKFEPLGAASGTCSFPSARSASLEGFPPQ